VRRIQKRRHHHRRRARRRQDQRHEQRTRDNGDNGDNAGGGLGSARCGICEDPTPVCDGGTCRDCRVQHECCGAINSGMRCEWGLCQQATGGTFDCQGFCDGTLSVCGQPVTCFGCARCPGAHSCFTENGPQGRGSYCVLPNHTQDCGPHGSCPDGQICCGAINPQCFVVTS
jgi:hypothetical protein